MRLNPSKFEIIRTLDTTSETNQIVRRTNRNGPPCNEEVNKIKKYAKSKILLPIWFIPNVAPCVLLTFPNYRLTYFTYFRSLDASLHRTSSSSSLSLFNNDAHASLLHLYSACSYMLILLLLFG
jgi:hypothetical protein